jgi:hypothetical protein
MTGALRDRVATALHEADCGDWCCSQLGTYYRQADIAIRVVTADLRHLAEEWAAKSLPDDRGSNDMASTVLADAGRRVLAMLDQAGDG